MLVDLVDMWDTHRVEDECVRPATSGLVKNKGGECLRDGPEGERAIAPDRPAGQHARSPTNTLPGGLPQQPRLPNPGLARDYQCRAKSVGQAIEGASKLPPLLVAADKHGA